jgi:CRP-like cAMP-binding protein
MPLNRRELLRGITLFTHLTDSEADAVIALMREVKAAKGEVIVSQGNEGGRLYLIVEGAVRVSRVGKTGREVTVAVLREGNFVGEMSLLDGQPRSADVIATKESRLLVLDRESFLRKVLPLPGIAKKVLAELSKRIRAANQSIEHLALGSVADRLFHLLGHAARRYTIKDGRAVIARGPTHQEMADMVGSSREAVSRTLAAMAEEGLIEVNRRRITLLPAFFERERR